MLAGEAAAHLDAGLEDFASRVDCAADLIRCALVVKNDRMQIAVAGVKYVADAQVIATADVGDHAQNPRQAGSRNDAVLSRVVRREAANRTERAFTRLPQQRALRFVTRESDARPGGQV